MINRTKKGEYQIIARVKKDGRILTKQETLRCSKEDAKQKYEQFKQELRSGCSPTNSSLISSKTLSTFSDVIDIYTEYLTLAGKLSLSHNRKIKRIRNELGAISINDFSNRFETWLKIECMVVRNKYGKPIPGRGGSSSKRNRLIEIVRAAFNRCVELKHLPLNPIDNVRFPKRKPIARDEYMTEEQMNHLLAVTEKKRPHIYPILKFALQVPCRKSELVNAKVTDLDLINNTIRIRNGQAKNDRGNYKPIPPNMIDYFRTLPKDTQWVFYRRDDDGVCRPLGSFRRAYHHCLKEARLEGYTFHSTRHISATHMVDRGTPERVVMTVANWKTNMLSNYYHREPRSAHQLIQWEYKGEGKVKGKVKGVC